MDLVPFILHATKQVPAVKFALGVAAVAAAGALITAWVGHGQAAIIITAGTFVSMILLFVFAGLVLAPSRPTMAGLILLYTTIIFFCSFLIMTVTAFLDGRPRAWAKVIGVVQERPDAIMLPLSEWLLPANVRFCLEHCSGRKELACSDDVEQHKEISKDFALSQKQMAPSGWGVEIEFANHDSGRAVSIEINNKWAVTALQNIDTGGWSCSQQHLVRKTVAQIPPTVLNVGENTVKISTTGPLPHLRSVIFTPL